MNNIPPGRQAPWEGEDEPVPDKDKEVVKSDSHIRQDDDDDIGPFVPPVGGIAE